MQIYTWDRQGFLDSYQKEHYKQLGCGAHIPKSCRCNNRTITYSRKFFDKDNLFLERAKNLINNFSMISGSSIFVVGCGLGFLTEKLKELGMNAHGCDDSSYLHSIKSREKLVYPVHNISALNENFSVEVFNTTGLEKFDFVVTEDLLSSHDSYDLIFNNCESILNSQNKRHICHIINPDVGEPLIKKTFSEWKNLNENYTWLNMIGKKEQ
jgi:2-polyprenyl-3-methyl-5-hydroxy-6-metoxy-1,4-benzoquinol methylase